MALPLPVSRFQTTGYSFDTGIQYSLAHCLAVNYGAIVASSIPRQGTAAEMCLKPHDHTQMAYILLQSSSTILLGCEDMARPFLNAEA
jgi:hypothetical protein